MRPLLAASLLLTACASEKKLIEFGWDEPDPAFLRDHAGEMARTPFDGAVFHINDFTWKVWSTRAFREEDLRPAVAELKAVPRTRLRHNFLTNNVWIYTETRRWWSKEGLVKLPAAYDAALRRARPADER